MSFIYRPYSEGMREGNVFAGVCPFMTGEGVLQAQVISLAPSPRSFPRVPHLGLGYPLPVGLGYSPAWTGVSPLAGTGYPTWRQYRRVSTCYAVGGTPLPVTQEDFLVSCGFQILGQNIGLGSPVELLPLLMTNSE